MLLRMERTAHTEVRTSRKALLVPTGVGHVLRDAVASLPSRPPRRPSLVYTISIFIYFISKTIRPRDVQHIFRASTVGSVAVGSRRLRCLSRRSLARCRVRMLD